MNPPLDAGAGPQVLSAVSDGVRTITMNRGDRYNALSTGMIAALDTALDAAAADRDTRVVVIAGAGKAFCAGHDLKEMREHIDPAWQQGLFDACGRMMMKLTAIPQPVIARVHGAAAAAGCQLVSMCDLAVCTDDARFGMPGVKVGIFCSTPAVGVARNIGRKRAMEMLLTGDMVDAATALEWGLVNTVVPVEQLDAAVARFTDRIVARSGPVIANGKRTFYAQLDPTLGEAYDVAGCAMVTDMAGADSAEGIDAFLAKRPAVWPSGAVSG